MMRVLMVVAGWLLMAASSIAGLFVSYESIGWWQLGVVLVLLGLTLREGSNR